MLKILKSLILLNAIFGITAISAQNSLYDPTQIQKIEIFFENENWNSQMDSIKLGLLEGEFIPGAIKINGTYFDEVGFKYKGNSTYNPSFKKKPWNISINEYHSYSYDGYTTIKLANIYADPSMVREAVAYNILKNYMICPKANFAEVYVNDVYIGLYTNTESINNSFCTRNFGSKGNSFFECSTTLPTASPINKGNFRYVSADSMHTQYQSAYELKSAYGWNDLLTLCNAITNNPSTVENYIYIDKAIWMLAFDNIIISLDSYIGVFAQNHYIYKDSYSGLFHPIVWDLNMSFGAFAHAGQGATGMGTVQVNNLSKIPLTLHQGDQYWPLINVILNNQQYKRMYYAHAKTIYNDFFANARYKEMAEEFKTLINPRVPLDTNKFFSNYQYIHGMDSTFTYGSLTIPGLAAVMDARTGYLSTVPEFLAEQPEIENVYAYIDDNELFVTAVITNATNIFFAYRKGYTNNEFIKVPMFDDGNHGDDGAGDGIYGASIPGISDLRMVDYYIYAENDEAGIFSPERASFEYYSYDCSADETDIYWINDDFSTHATESAYIQTVLDRPTLPNNLNLTTYYANIEGQDGCNNGNGLRIRGLGDGGYAEFTVPNTQHTSIWIKAKSTSANRVAKVFRNGEEVATFTGLDINNCVEYIDDELSLVPVTYKVSGGTPGNTDPIVITSITVEKYHTVKILTQPQGGIYGSVSQLSVVAEGEGTLKYQWYKGGEIIANATAAAYTPDKAAAYYVIVKDDYDSLKSKTVNITKALLTVTAQNDTVIKGFNPDNYIGYYSISGFVNNENENSLINLPTVKIANHITSETPVGEYPNAIIAGEATADNYRFNYIHGTLFIKDDLSISDVSDSRTAITIYPNPANDKLFVKCVSDDSPKQIRILDITGACVYEKIFYNNDIIIDIQSLSPSLYILQAIDCKGVNCGKFVKE